MPAFPLRRVRLHMHNIANFESDLLRLSRNTASISFEQHLIANNPKRRQDVPNSGIKIDLFTLWLVIITLAYDDDNIDKWCRHVASRLKINGSSLTTS